MKMYLQYCRAWRRNNLDQHTSFWFNPVSLKTGNKWIRGIWSLCNKKIRLYCKFLLSYHLCNKIVCLLLQCCAQCYQEEIKDEPCLAFFSLFASHDIIELLERKLIELCVAHFRMSDQGKEGQYYYNKKSKTLKRIMLPLYFMHNGIFKPKHWDLKIVLNSMKCSLIYIFSLILLMRFRCKRGIFLVVLHWN